MYFVDLTASPICPYVIQAKCFIEFFGWKVLEPFLPTYSPDLASSDFHLVCCHKHYVGGTKHLCCENGRDITGVYRRWLQVSVNPLRVRANSLLKY